MRNGGMYDSVGSMVDEVLANIGISAAHTIAVTLSSQLTSCVIPSLHNGIV